VTGRSEAILEDSLPEVLGTPFLAYVCAADEEQMRKRLADEIRFDDRRERTLAELLQAALMLLQQSHELETPATTYRQSPFEILSPLATCAEPAGMGYLTELRQRAGDVIETFDSGDLVRDALLTLARDYYPCLLLPRRNRGPFDHNPFPISLSHFSFDHPATDRIIAGLNEEDEPLRELFPAGVLAKETGAKQVLTRSGRGGTVQAGLLPSSLLINAEPRAWLSGEISLRGYLDAVAAELAAVRALVRGEEVLVPVTVGFRAVEVPEGFELDTPWGVLRSPNPWQQRWAPTSADIVLEIAFPMAAQMVDGDLADTFKALGAEFFSSRRELDNRIDQMRLAFLLGSAAETPVGLAPAWTFIPDPLQLPGFQYGLRETRHTAAKVGDSQLPRLKTWMKTIEERYDSALDLPTRRLLTAVTERLNPEDGLVDAMIALESLFGTGRGEIRFRLSVALAWLLGTDHESRRDFQKQVKDLYDLRSHVVHGGHLDAAKAEEARTGTASIAIEALRALFSERPELIGDGERGRTLAIAG
jgi:hypothetical protein